MDGVLADHAVYRTGRRIPQGMSRRMSHVSLVVVLVAHGLAGYALWQAQREIPPQPPLVMSVRIVPPTVTTAPPKPEVNEQPLPKPPKLVAPQAKPKPAPKLLAAAAPAPTPVAVSPAPTFSEPDPAPAVPETAAPAAKAAAAAAPEMTQPRFDAAYLDNPKPPYPNLSRRLGEQGRVLLRVQVAADGSAQNVQLQTSSGYSRLDDIALDTVKRWKFVPAKRGDEPVAATVLVPIIFSLKG
jgi:protein TonB